MVKDTAFLAYWRELAAQCALLGKRAPTLGMARAAYRHCTAAAAARYMPASGRL